MTTRPPDDIVPAEFPQLKLLVWNRDPACPIAADEAFSLYERNWRFIDREHLTVSEAALIRDLTDTVGRGVFLGS